MTSALRGVALLVMLAIARGELNQKECVYGDSRPGMQNAQMGTRGLSADGSLVAWAGSNGTGQRVCVGKLSEMHGSSGDGITCSCPFQMPSHDTSLSADGSVFVFEKSDKVCVAHVALMVPNTDSGILCSSLNGAQFPSMAADGTRFSFGKILGGACIGRIREMSNGTHHGVLCEGSLPLLSSSIETRIDAKGKFIVWSQFHVPGGRVCVTEVDRMIGGGTTGTRCVPLAGLGTERVQAGGVGISADGKVIAFLAVFDEIDLKACSARVAGIRAGTTDGVVCTALWQGYGSAYNMDLSADGSRFIWTAVGKRAEVFLVEVAAMNDGTNDGVLCTKVRTGGAKDPKLSESGMKALWSDGENAICASDIPDMRNDTNSGIHCLGLVASSPSSTSLSADGSVWAISSQTSGGLCFGTT